MLRAILSICLVLSLVPLPLSAADAKQAATGTDAAPAATAPPEIDERYKIGPGDVLDVRVFDRPELSRAAVRVDGAGVIRMPLLEADIVAGCSTEAELAARIEDLYRSLLVDPHVDVFVVTYSSQPVAVMGAVLQPSSFQLERRVRLRELLTLAGGPKENAGTHVQILRDEHAPVCEGDFAGPAVLLQVGDNETVELPQTQAGIATIGLDALMRGEPGSNPYIRPGDLVNVPPAEHVYVVGNVHSPSTLPLKKTLTLSEAIAMAGGILPQTDRDNIRIIRRDPDTQTNSAIVVNLKNVQRMEGHDPALQSGDIVEVPKSGTKIFLRAMMMTSAQMSVWLPLVFIR
jgi:polysaccharide export outer membrane protein